MTIRTTLLALLLSAAFYAGCNRDDETIVVVPATDTAFNFRVNGITDVSLFPGQSAGSYLYVELISGEQETVRLALTGVPSGVDLQMDPVSGIPSFASELYFNASPSAVPGTYPLTLTATSETKGAKTFRFNLIIKEFPNCDSLFGGAFTVSDGCSSGSPYPVNISLNSSSSPSSCVVTNFKAGGTVTIPQLNAYIDCQNRSFYVPSQQVGSVTIYGSGYLSGGSINFNYSYYSSSGGSSSCTAIFSR